MRNGQGLLTGSLLIALNTSSPSTQKAKAGELWILGQTGLHSKHLSQNNSHKMAVMGWDREHCKDSNLVNTSWEMDLFAAHLHSGSVLPSVEASAKTVL